MSGWADLHDCIWSLPVLQGSDYLYFTDEGTEVQAGFATVTKGYQDCQWLPGDRNLGQPDPNPHKTTLGMMLLSLLMK